MFSLLKCLRYTKCSRYFHSTKTIRNKEMKFLNVAEKNDAAKTIAGLLSNGAAHRREGYSVYNKIYDFEAQVRGRNAKMVMTSVSGHLMRLEFLVSYRNWRNVDPRSLFDAPIRKTVGEDYQGIKRTLEREIRGCQGLIIWTDCDREGENIGYEIIEVCRAIKPNLTIYRASFSEITTPAVRRALQQLGEPDKRQSDAVDVRTELDLRTGAAITRFQTLRLQRLFPEKIADKLISYGSCQIPTLGFVAERYKEIEAFVSEAFWKIRVLHTIEELTVEFNWARNRLFDKEACENYLLLCLAEPEPRATVESVTVKPKHKWRPTPLDTVEMEKLGSRKLKLSAKETMAIAEKLYSKGLISYPRTETNQFSKEFALAPLVEQQTEHEAWGAFARRVLEWGPNPRNGNKSDQAHPPIHPTKMVTNLQGNEARVYELVVRHFLACVSKDAVGSETIVNIDIAGEKFSANGLVIYERNYLDVYVYDKWSAKQIHDYKQGQRFEPTEIMLHEGATTAPPLLTEADLIALMEKHGIGTDATHAEHINTIKERGYIGVVDKGALIPGVIGMGLYEGYDAMELALAKPQLRAEFEADLKRICLGEKDPKQVLREQVAKYKQAYQQITDKITAMDAKISQRLNETPVATPANDTAPEASGSMIRELFQCPKCDTAPLALKPKKNPGSFFIGCLNFPDCKNVVWLPEECKDYQVLDECCAQCGEGYHMLKFRFSTPYYRGLFNAPSGWYKNCLRCDELFRNTFNINLDQVKRVGRIVAQTNGAGSGPGPGPGGGGSRTGGGATVSGWGTTGGGAGGDGASKGSKSKGNTASKTTKKAAGGVTATRMKRNSKTEATTGTGGIRSYFTGVASSRTASLDGFFDSNDGFEEQMLAAASVVETNPLPAAELDDDIAAAFAADDDADFEALVNAGGSNPQPPPSPPPAGEPQNLDDSLTQWMKKKYEADEVPMVWGRQARAAAEAQPAPKRVRLSDASMPDAVAPSAVLCSGCHQPALQLTTRSAGPNQGRQFYKCPKQQQCKFFQWADEQPPATSGDNPTRVANSGAAAQTRTRDSQDKVTWGTAGAANRNNNSWGTSQDSDAWGSGNSSSGWGTGGAAQQRSRGSEDSEMWGSNGAANRRGSASNETISWGSAGAAVPTSRTSQDYSHNASSWGTGGAANQKGGSSNANWGSNNATETSSWGSSKNNTSSWNNSQPNRNNATKSAATSRGNNSNITSSFGGTKMRSNSSSTVTITQSPKRPAANSNNVQCNCGKPAISLIVRKETPNKGRPFYSCANREKSCGFFQWADTDENQGNQQQGRSSATKGTRAAPAPTNGNRQGRRCGLCREEGHTRNKCPRKNDFDC
ncbi:DNA topoisomerase 3-alpha [Drosophila nasuta]|uniref:DNA topoisomerase 3-alpha n=1 Tax=Drosophila nasuta TaxID=42062 RepID=UPI00295E568F|nr:DNA topoisomerase 3-alpha [Drosophila nasuta]